MEEIIKYVTAEVYINETKDLKNGERKNIYSDMITDIEVEKVGRKIYTFVNKYGEGKLNDALNNLCGLV